jgi:MFS transporter, FHS family, L-fucose permease
MQRSRAIVGLVFLIFFVISFLTNILGPLVPDIIASFSLSLTLAGFLPFSFFVAYGVLSIPAGTFVERRGERAVMAAAFAAACAGAALFALVPTYRVAVGSLFLIGAGMAVLQVAINPLLRVAGGEEHFAFNSVFAQLVFGLASFLSPRVYTYLVQGLQADAPGNWLLAVLSRVVPDHLPWVSLYWVFAAVTLVMVVVVAATRLPRVELKEEERTGALATYRDLLRRPVVLLYFFGIFAYVGSEQGIANWISEFLRSYHGFDPTTTGAAAVSWFWGLMTVGCLLGMGLLKLYDSRLVLRGFAAAAIVTLTVALFGPATTALWAFPALGFCLSVMWSIVFSLALNSLPSHHGAFSGILCTGIVGGAVVPLVVGALGDWLGLRGGMVVLYLTLGYVFSVGVWARPLITNETTWRRRGEAGPR